MKSVSTILKRVKQLEFSAIWMSHCKDPSAFITDLCKLIELDEDGYIIIFQQKNRLNPAYVMRDVLYVFHEDDVKAERIIWEAPYLEMKLKALELPKGMKGQSRAYLDNDPVDWMSVQEGMLSWKHKGNYPIGVILIYFTKAMTDFIPGDKRFMQFFISYLARTCTNYKNVVKAVESLFETFDDFDILLNSNSGKVVTTESKNTFEDKKLKKPQVDYDYLVESEINPVKAINKLPKLFKRISELKDNPAMCNRDKDRLEKIIKMIQFVEDTIRNDSSTKRLTYKDIMKSIGMNKDAFNTMLDKAKSEYDKLTIRPGLPDYRPKLTTNNKKFEIERKLDQLLKKYFTPEFLTSNWLDFANAKAGTGIN